MTTLIEFDMYMLAGTGPGIHAMLQVAMYLATMWLGVFVGATLGQEHRTYEEWAPEPAFDIETWYQEEADKERPAPAPVRMHRSLTGKRYQLVLTPPAGYRMPSMPRNKGRLIGHTRKWNVPALC